MFNLYRYDYGDFLTAGVLLVNGIYICDTLELPWRENRSGISCIPEGKYPIEKYISPKHGECILLKDTGIREYVEIHAANRVGELKGCIAPGVKQGNTVVQSREKLDKLLKLLDKDSFIEIVRLGEMYGLRKL